MEEKFYSDEENKVKLDLSYDLDIGEHLKFSEEPNFDTYRGFYFDGSTKRSTSIETFDGENYLYVIDKKIGDQFGILQRLIGQNNEFRLDNQFRNKIKEIILEIYKIVRKERKYFKLIAKRERTPRLKIKYLFVSVVYLKLKNDLYTQMGDFFFEIGLDDLIAAYGAEGANEITHRNVWKYLTFTKAIIKDYNFDL